MLTAVIAFIVIPKNTGLKQGVEKALLLIENVQETSIIEVRGEDVPEWLAKLTAVGKRAIGLTGEDLYREYCLNSRSELKILKRVSWDDSKAMFRKPALCLLGPVDKSLETLPRQLTVCMPEKYKKLSKKYLNQLEDKGYNFRKLYLNGAIESTYTAGISDVLIDIVYSGSTMRQNGLRVYDKILSSDFLILSNENQTKGERDES